MNFRYSVITLAVLLIITSCGQDKHEPALLDSMPAGYDIYVTFRPSEIDAGAILSNIREIAMQAQQQMPFPVAGILGFDPFDWDAWVSTFALDPEGEIGLVIALADDEPELIALFLPSTEPDRVQEFIDGLVSQAPDMEAIPLITESEGYVILAGAPEQSILDEFNASLGTHVGTDEIYAELREQSVPCTSAIEVFIDAPVLAESGQEAMLVTCFSVESNLSIQFISRMYSMEALEYSALVSHEPSGNSMKIPADATCAMHVSMDMAALKGMVTSNMPPDAQMGAAMLGFGSINELLDIFSGDAWFALQTDGENYSGLVAYGLSNAGALQELLGNLTGLMEMAGEDYTSFQFQGNTCFRIDVQGLPGIESFEIGVVDDVFVIAGGYSLQNVADGVTFDNYLERTGLDITDEGGFALAADFGALADAYDLNRETDNIVDFEEFGFVTMSGTADGAVIQFNVSIDLGSGNPFSIITDTIAKLALEGMYASIEEPTPDVLPPVEMDLSVEDKEVPPSEEPVQTDSIDIETSSEPLDQG